MLFLEGCQMGAVLCKPYAVMPKQFLPSGTNSRFSHYCPMMKEWVLESELTFRKILGSYLTIRELGLNYCKHSYI